MSDKRKTGEAVLKMFYIAKEEKVGDVDMHKRLEAFIDGDWVIRGVKWCNARKYINDHGITKRGRRYMKNRITPDDYEKYKKIMLDILCKGSGDA